MSVPAAGLPADWIDVDKLAAAATAAALDQPPEIRLEILAAIERSDIQVTEDDDGWLALSIEGNAFLRAHQTRVLRVPEDPGAN